MKCTELVHQDHVLLRRGLDILDGMVQKLEDGERIEVADITAILKFLRLFGDEYHQTIEDKVLFPALLRAAPQESPIRQMLMDHSELRALIAGIEEALKSRIGTEFVRNSRGLSLLLRNHLDKEETVLQDIPELSLSKEEDNVVVAAFTKNRTQPETYTNFPRLEWKYTPKPRGVPLGREPARQRRSASFR